MIVLSGCKGATKKESKVIFYTIAVARELGFNFVQDSSTNWIHLAKDDSVQARCNSRYRVVASNGTGADFECQRCMKVIQKAKGE
jgi:hypothetical protein